VACEVPLPRNSVSLIRAPEYAVSMLEPGSRSDTTPSPGATRSSRFHEPLLLSNVDSSSSAVLVVPFVDAEPTPITNRSFAGSLSEVAASLPAAATTTMPAFHARSAAYCTGSVQAGGVPPLP
jgi:hypothetical protein